MVFFYRLTRLFVAAVSCSTSKAYLLWSFLPYYGLFWLAGLTCHRLRPFTVASCSRDSTVRVWSLSQLASPLQIDVLANRPLDEIMTPNTGNEHTNQFAQKKRTFSFDFSVSLISLTHLARVLGKSFVCHQNFFTWWLADCNFLDIFSTNQKLQRKVKTIVTRFSRALHRLLVFCSALWLAHFFYYLRVPWLVKVTTNG